MKKQFLFLGALLLTCAMSFAQTNVKIQIDHQLGAEDFAFNTVASNNMGHNFKLDRCEYYLSGFQLVHDGGQVIEINDLYALVQADQTFEIDLGAHDVTMIEALRFFTGVDEATNHLDPALFPMDHPLAPKFPSMHWGWASGYRFIAVEGQSGVNTNFTMQIHGLGNKHYYGVELPMNMTATNGNLVLPVVADMARVFEGIQMNDGFVEHGENNQAATAMHNMRDYVFSSASTTSEKEAIAVQSFDVFPNPTTSGMATVTLNLEAASADFQIAVTDILGKQIFLSTSQRTSSTQTIEVATSGVYVVSVLKNGKAVLNKKLVVQ